MPEGCVNQYERAFRAWPLLTTAATNHSTITYADLADHLHIHPRPIRYVLGVLSGASVGEYGRRICGQNNLSRFG